MVKTQTQCIVDSVGGKMIFKVSLLSCFMILVLETLLADVSRLLPLLPEPASAAPQAEGVRGLRAGTCRQSLSATGAGHRSTRRVPEFIALKVIAPTLENVPFA